MRMRVFLVLVLVLASLVKTRLEIKLPVACRCYSRKNGSLITSFHDPIVEVINFCSTIQSDRSSKYSDPSFLLWWKGLGGRITFVFVLYFIIWQAIVRLNGALNLVCKSRTSGTSTQAQKFETTVVVHS